MPGPGLWDRLKAAGTPSPWATPTPPDRPPLRPNRDTSLDIPQPTQRAGRVYLPDPRPLPETEKMKGYYDATDVGEVVRNALERDVDPALATAVAVQEGVMGVAQRPDTSFELKRPPFDAHTDIPNMPKGWPGEARPDFARNLRAHAARTPTAPLATQLKAWNGTGDSALPRAYGKAKGERSPTEFPDRVLGIRDTMTSKSPALAALIAQVTKEPFVPRAPRSTPGAPSANGEPTWDDEVAFAQQDLERKRKYPRLLKPDQ